MYQESCNETASDHHPALDAPVMDDELDQDVHSLEMLIELARENGYPVPKLGERTFWTADGLEYCPILTRQENVYAGYIQCDGQTIHVEFSAPVGATTAQKDRRFVAALIAAGCLMDHLEVGCDQGHMTIAQAGFFQYGDGKLHQVEFAVQAGVTAEQFDSAFLEALLEAGIAMNYVEVGDSWLTPGSGTRTH